ncbi:MAG: GNAT family N-acyltransferase [Pseudomonadota bacterium]
MASGAADIAAAQRLRYDVFVEELGGGGPMVDHAARREIDRFDPFAVHMLLHDDAADGAVVGVYRMLDAAAADRAGQFYSEDEFDLGPLRRSGRRLLELGRSCLHAQYRGGAAMVHLWRALAAYVAERGVEILFGAASFHGTDTAALAQPLSLLHHRHLAPAPLRVRARKAAAMDLVPEAALDRKAAMLEVPSLIKAYLRLGGTVGHGAYLDHAFNTTDVCLILDTARMNARQAHLYTRAS